MAYSKEQYYRDGDLPPTEKINDRPASQLECLKPDIKEVHKIIEEGNLPVFFPSLARLFRIFGRLPTAEEVSLELMSLGILPAAEADKVEGWFQKSEELFAAYQPVVGKLALYKWKRDRGFWSEVELQEFTNEAILAMRAGLIFNFDWQRRDPGLVEHYLMRYVSLWLKKFSMKNQQDRSVVEFQEERLLKPGMSRSVEEEVISRVQPSSAKEDLDNGVRKGRGRIDQRVRIAQYCLRKPPFAIKDRSVFTDLALEQVIKVLASLTLPDLFLVLTYLGYFPFEGRKKMAAQMGYSETSLFVHKNRPYLTQVLERAVQEATKVQAEDLPVNRLTLKQLIERVQVGRESGVLARTKDKFLNQNLKRSVLQKILAELDLNEPVNSCIYERLSPAQKTILDLIRQKNEEGNYVWRVASLARHFGFDPSDLRRRLKKIAAFFQEREFPVRKISLYRRAQVIFNYPRLSIDHLTPTQQKELALFLGFCFLKGKQQGANFPLSIAEIGRQLGRRLETVYASIELSLEKLKRFKEQGFAVAPSRLRTEISRILEDPHFLPDLMALTLTQREEISLLLGTSNETLIPLSVTEISRRLGRKRETVKESLKLSLKKLIRQKERCFVVRFSLLRERARRIFENPAGIISLEALTPLQRRELALFLGMCFLDDKEDGNNQSLIPMNMCQIGRLLNRKPETVHMSLKLSVGKLVNQGRK